MPARIKFTDEQKAELLCSPYVARTTDFRVTFSLKFKKLVMDNIDRPGMTSTMVFDLAGFSRELFSPTIRRYVVNSIRKEAASEEGLREPAPVKSRSIPRKKHSETEFRELQERVSILEQQVEFLKKSQSLKQRKSLTPPNSSG